MNKLQLITDKRNEDFLLFQNQALIKIPKSKIPELIKELRLIKNVPETKVKVLDL